VNADYYYNATPGAAQRDITAALRAWRAVRALAEIRPFLDPIAFELEYNRMFTAIQNDLGAAGPGVVSSLPTELAHVLRQRAVDAEWQGLPPGATPYREREKETAGG
jgi:hypothetical protein